PVGNIYVIGDDHEAFMVEKRLTNGFGGGADVDEKRGVVGNEARCRTADRALFVRRDFPPRLIFHVLDAGRKQRPAMDAGQQALVAEIVEILADGLRRHVEMRGQVFDQHAAIVLGHLDDFGMARRQVHHKSLVSLFTHKRKRKRRKGTAGRRTEIVSWRLRENEPTHAMARATSVMTSKAPPTSALVVSNWP